MKKKPMGRPKKAEEDRATELLNFRVRPSDAELIRQAADGSYGGLSGWIRDVVLKAAHRETKKR